MRSWIKWSWYVVVLLALTMVGSGPAIGSFSGPKAAPPPTFRPDPAALIARVTCRYGSRAWRYASGLHAPDGLAFDPLGRLYVAEEEAGRVSRLGPAGEVIPVVSGLSSPEGLAFDADGALYVVEDVAAGRLLRVAPDGAVTVLAGGLAAPEGVVWAPDGTVYVTESNAQFVSSPWELATRLTAVTPAGDTRTVRTDLVLWSYAGLVMGADGLLYATSESSGLLNDESVFSVQPGTGARKLVVSGLLAPEGLRFARADGFPLYVVEEDAGGGGGRLQRVHQSGRSEVLCTGFYQLEDVAVDADGWLYVSEDTSGWVIAVEPPREEVYLPLLPRRQ